MQYRGECWVGNSMGKYGKRPDSECNMKCRHDSSRICGAGWRNSIFNLDGVKKTKVTVTTTSTVYTAIYGESSIGCYKDAGNRDLPNLLRAGYGNPSKCFKMAMDAGY